MDFIMGILGFFVGLALFVIYHQVRVRIIRKKFDRRIDCILDTALEEKKKGGFE